MGAGSRIVSPPSSAGPAAASSRDSPLGSTPPLTRALSSADAPTVGVLGGGHRRFFPPRNAGLAGRMLAGGGAVLSPFAPDQAARPGQFLARNGVVAALADAVLVVEAPARSGALNTASWAAGRVPVLAVPGDVDRARRPGCLALISDGATLARSPQDVLESLGRLTFVQPRRRAAMSRAIQPP